MAPHNELMIRHLAAASTADRVAAARFESLVSIWDLERRERLSTFETVLSYGGQRLALTPDGTACIAGAFHRHGVACYAAADGRMRWQRRDIKRVQYITAAPDGKRVFCGVASGPCVVLDVESGETLERWRGVAFVKGSPFSPVYLADGQRYQIRGDPDVIVSGVPRETQLLDAAFSPDAFCIAEFRASLRAFDVLTCKERWRYQPPLSHHLLDLAYRPSDECFLGVQRDCTTKALFELWRWSASTGDATRVTTLPESATFAFCRRGETLLASDGQMIDTRTGLVDYHLPLDQA